LKRLFEMAKEPAPLHLAAGAVPPDRKSWLDTAGSRAAGSSPASPAACGSRIGAA
jgi:hypothetical protein